MGSLWDVIPSPWRVAVSVFVLCFGVYLATLAPSVGFIDAGELTAVACTLGIAHPTGYPLFTLIGWVFAQLPVGSEEIVRLNIMAAFFTAAAILLFVFLLVRLLPVAGGRQRDVSEAHILIPAAAAALTLGFSETVWINALSVEVYSLHLFFLVLVLLLFLRAAGSALSGGRGGSDDRSWYLFAFAVGLAFTNHMTTVLLAPGLLYLYFSLYGFRRESLRRIFRMSVPFLFGLTPYFYLPIRGSQDILFSWGDPTTVDRFFSHLRGKQYSVWIFSSAETAGRQFSYFVSSLPGEFALPGLILSLIGALLLLRKNRRLGIAVALFFFVCLLYAINYDIHDIDSYFLLAYVAMAIWVAVTLVVFFRWLRTKLPGIVLPSIAVLLIGFVPLGVQYAERDESDNYLVEDYTRNMFESFDSNAVVFSFQWDYWVSASYYYQYVRGVRKDLLVIDKELLRRSWYLKELRRRHPWIMERVETEAGLFERELYKFEHGLPYEGPVIQGRFVEMIQAMIRAGLDSRPVYVTGEIEPEFTQGLQRVPDGLAFRLVREPGFVPTERPDLEFRPFGRMGRLEDQVRRLYAEAWAVRGAYYYSMGNDRNEADLAIRNALALDPASGTALLWNERLKALPPPAALPK